ncbi:hypothetical protein GN958_ATG04639 [Phytophthora infestans]|uniref:Uncharacterized protein n=1 Tax=Phytophthora infestans TaxID=4787 RepID=A0A8S9V3T4_PHYIN|nr:hypothetical protein GN958_ATG04639 [Phytophthora infestans]
MRNRDLATQTHNTEEPLREGVVDLNQATVLVLPYHAPTVVMVDTGDGVRSLPWTTAAKVTQKSSRTLIENPHPLGLVAIDWYSSSLKRAWM